MVAPRGTPLRGAIVHMFVVFVNFNGGAIPLRGARGVFSGVEFFEVIGSATGNRTPIVGLKTRCPNR